MSVQKSWSELQTMQRACKIVVDTLDVLEAAAQPGVTTKELDRVAREAIEKAGARPAFLGYRGYPATLCISVNEEVVHGIPGPKRLKEGDIVGLDLGCIVRRLLRRRRAHGGGRPRERRGRAADARRRARRCSPGSTCAARASASATSATRCRRTPRATATRWCGSSWATASAPACTRSRRSRTTGRPGRRERLVPGMCLAIEPMVNVGGPEVELLADGWTAVTRDGSLSAHFELSVAVTEHGPWILSEPYPYAREERRMPEAASAARRRRARRSRWRPRCARRCRTRSSASSSRAAAATRWSRTWRATRACCGCGRGTGCGWRSHPTTRARGRIVDDARRSEGMRQ